MYLFYPEKWKTQKTTHINHDVRRICRERRTQFEAQLMSERKKIEVFRLRETKEFLSIDELREKCETSDQFMDILKVQNNLTQFIV